MNLLHLVPRPFRDIYTPIAMGNNLVKSDATTQFAAARKATSALIRTVFVAVPFFAGLILSFEYGILPLAAFTVCFLPLSGPGAALLAGGLLMKLAITTMLAAKAITEVSLVFLALSYLILHHHDHNVLASIGFLEPKIKEWTNKYFAFVWVKIGNEQEKNNALRRP